jgi:hypothetical protein
MRAKKRIPVRMAQLRGHEKPLLKEHDLLGSPAWFPLRHEMAGELTMIKLDETAYKTISFLDERILARSFTQAACATWIFDAAATKLKPRSHYVFHTGHVGSTLISRLLGEHRRLFVLREPALLRVLANDPTLQFPNTTAASAANLARVLAILARTWRPEQRAVIKATSFVNELAELILAGVDKPHAMLVFAKPYNYLCGILAGPNSRIESRALATSRSLRLTRRLGGIFHAETCSEGEQVAMSWLSEMIALHQAALRFPSQVKWVDFDVFLREPLSELGAIFHALDVEVSSAQLAALLAGPIMRQYSKAPEYAYDAALRVEVLQSADREHAAEIARGMKWLENAAVNNNTIATILKLGFSLKGGEPTPPALKLP